MKKKNTQHSPHTVCFHERTLVAAVRQALPYVVGLSLALSLVPSASSRSSDSAAAFTATQLVRQFTLKNTVSQVSLGMQGYIADVGGQQRGPAMGPRPSGFPADMGSVPNTVNLPQRDGAGRPLGYCAWDNTTLTASADYNAGQGVANPLVYAVVSPGLNGSMQTTCAYILQNGSGQGDDHVQVATPIQVSSKQFKTAVGSYADLQNTPGEEGDIRLAQDTNRLYTYKNGVWTDVFAGPFVDNSGVNGAGAISYTTGTVTVADFQATTASITGAVTADNATFTNGVIASTFAGNGAGLTDLNANNINGGIVNVANGGTGVDGSAAANGTLLIGNGTGYTLGAITGTVDQINVTNGAGTITLSLPQSIATTSTPTFGGMVLNGNLAGTNATFSGQLNAAQVFANGQELLPITKTNIDNALTFPNQSTYVDQPNLALGTNALGGAFKSGGNVAIGDGVLSQLDGTDTYYGEANTGVGYRALYANTTGYSNTALGNQALYSNTMGYLNTALGNQALYSNTTGSLNNAIGDQALYSNSTGLYNNAVGNFALYSNTTGSYNSAMGYRALYTNTTGLYNVAVGALALEANTVGESNSALGYIALWNNTTGSENTAIGRLAMRDNTTGNENTGLGALALYSNTTANFNTAVGSRALYRTNTGGSNVAVGHDAAYSGTTASNNVSIGRFVMRDVTNGSNNVALGSFTLRNITTGNANVALGRTAGQSNGGYGGDITATTTGSKNTFIGTYSGAEGGGQTLYSTTLGADSRVSTNDTVVLGALAANKAGSLLDDQVVIGVTSRNDAFANTRLYVNGVTNLNGDLRGTTANFTGAVTIASLTAQRLDVMASTGVVNPNMIVGAGAMDAVQSGNGGNSAIGILALGSNTSGQLNTATGLEALRLNTSGSFNTANGFQALYSNGSGYSNSAFGINSMLNTTTGFSNTALGGSSGAANTTGSNNTFLGAAADASSGALTFATAIGAGSRVGTSNTIALGRNSNLDQIVIGTDTRNDTFANTKLYVNGVTNLNGDLRGTNATFSGAVVADGGLTVNGTFSVQRLNVNDPTGVTYGNLAIGVDNLLGAQSGDGANIAIGYGVLRDNTTGSGNTAIGYNSQTKNTTGYSNVSVGANSLFNNTTGNRNTAIGEGALLSNTTGFENSALGDASLSGNTTGAYNSAFGAFALQNNTTGSSNTAFGQDTLRINTSGVDNTALGREALRQNTTGGDNVATGIYALRENTTGYSNTAVGRQALNSNTSGYGNVAVGREAMRANTTGSSNVVLGIYALDALGSGDNNLALGADAGSRGFDQNLISGSDNSFVGGYSGPSFGVNTLQFGAAIGAYAEVATNNTIALGRNSNEDQIVIGTDTRNDAFAGTKLFVNGVTNLNGDLRGTTATFTGAVTMGSLSLERLDVITSAGAVTYPNMIVGAGAMAGVQSGAGGNTALGISALAANTSGELNSVVGYQALRNNTIGERNAVLGSYALFTNTTGYSNVAIGNDAMYYNTSGARNVAIGERALFNNGSGFWNVAVGEDALYGNVDGYFNVALGNRAIESNTSGSANVAIGMEIMRSNTTGDNNIALGYHAFDSNTTGRDNVAIGQDALSSNTTGNFNTALGYNSNTSSGNLSYATAIGAGSRVGTSNTIALGRNSNVDQIVIGTDTRNDTYANTKLYVSGATFLNGDVNIAGVLSVNGSPVGSANKTGIDSALTFGTGNLTLGINSLQLNSGGARNTAFGQSSLTGGVNLSGTDNTALGFGALQTVSNANGFNVAIGAYALNAGPNINRNVAIGYEASRFNGSNDNVAIGSGAARNNTSGSRNLAIGTQASFFNGSQNDIVAIGYQAAYGDINFTSGNIVALGNYALQNLSSGSNSVAIGNEALRATTTGANNVALGRSAGDTNTTGNSNTLIGHDSDVISGALSFAAAFGAESRVGTSNTIALGRNSNVDQIVIGTDTRNDTTANTKLYVNGDTRLNGTLFGTNATFSGTVTMNSLALQRLDLASSAGGVGSPNVIVGLGAMAGAQSGNGGNTAVGQNTLNANTTGWNNVAIGRSALGSNTTGDRNISIGALSSYLNTTGNYNVVMGDEALFSNTGGISNTAIGIKSLRLSTGNSNTALGESSGEANTTGSNNTFLGSLADASAGDLIYATAIGSGSRVATSNTIALGRNSNLDQVVIGTNSRSDTFANTKLYVNGVTNLNGDLQGTTATFSGAVTTNSLAAQRLDVATSAGGVSFINLIVGSGAMSGAQTGGGGNTAVGYYGLSANSSGEFNTASGHRALQNNTTGSNNSAFGRLSMSSNTTGFGNAAFGIYALQGAQTSFFNSAFGSQALQNTTGSSNTGIGQIAGFDTTTGSNNAFVGSAAGRTNTTGSFNSAFGVNAQPTSGALEYATVIGADARVATSNTMVLGRSDGSDQVVIGASSRSDDHANTKLRVGGNIAASSLVVDSSIASGAQGAYLQWNRSGGSGATYLINQKGLGPGGISFGESTAGNAYAENMHLSAGGNLSVVGSMTATAFNVSSDRRLKTNLSQLDTDNVLDKLETLRTYSYDYIANRDLGRRIGVIAQELQPLFPEAVAVRADGFMAVDYNALGAMAAVGVGQLNNKFKALDKKVTEQGDLITALDDKVTKVDTRVAVLESWKTEVVGRMDGMQIAIDSNVKKIAENALAIQGNTTEIKRLDDVLIALDGTVKGNSESINNINKRWSNTFSASEDGSLLTVIATELKVSNFTAEKMRSNSVYTQRLEAEIAAIRELEVDSLKANTAVANSVQGKVVNTGAVQVYAGVGAPAFLFAAPSDGHYTVNTSAMDGSYATATVIVNAGQAKVVPIASEGIELMAIGNSVKANAAGKSIKASWIKTG